MLDGTFSERKRGPSGRSSKFFFLSPRGVVADGKDWICFLEHAESVVNCSPLAALLSLRYCHSVQGGSTTILLNCSLTKSASLTSVFYGFRGASPLFLGRRLSYVSATHAGAATAFVVLRTFFRSRFVFYCTFVFDERISSGGPK